jgi:hypothetical protein
MSDHRRADRRQGIDLLVGQQVDEMLTDRAHVRRRRFAQGGPAGLGEEDHSAPAVLLTGLAVDQAARLHPVHVMRQPAGRPGQPLRQIAGPPSPVGRLAQRGKHVVVGL